MKLFFLKALSLSILVSSLSHADIVGNGAKGIKRLVEENGDSFYLLHLMDLWELNLHEDAYIPSTVKLQDPMKVQELIEKKLRFMQDDEQAMLLAKLNEIYAFDRVLGLSLVRALLSFQWAKSPEKLKSTPDNESSSRDVDIRQIAVRRGGRITVSGPYWDGVGSEETPTLTSVSMVATIIHELVYSLVRPQLLITMEKAEYQKLQATRTQEIVGYLFDGPLNEKDRFSSYEIINAELPTMFQHLKDIFYTHILEDDLRFRLKKLPRDYIPTGDRVVSRLLSGGRIDIYPRLFIEYHLNGSRGRFAIPLGLSEERLQEELEDIETFIEEHHSVKPDFSADPFAPEDPHAPPPTRVDLSTLNMDLHFKPVATRLSIKASSAYGYRELLWPQAGEVELVHEDLRNNYLSYESEEVKEFRNESFPYRDFIDFLESQYRAFSRDWETTP